MPLTDSQNKESAAVTEETQAQPEYEPPVVVDYGDLVDLTAGHGHGHGHAYGNGHLGPLPPHGLSFSG